MQSEQPSELSERPFRLFWLGLGISAIGDAFGMVAMPLLVLEVTGSVAQMGLVTALACAGQIMAGVGSGVVVDRVDRRRLMMASDLGRLFLFLLLPILVWLGRASIGVIAAVAFCAGVFGNIFTVAQLAAVPNLVGPQQVARANGRLQATQAVGYVVGGLLGGLVASQLDAAAALTMNALSFGGSAACLAVIRFHRDAPADPATRGANHLSDLAIGVRFLLRDATLRSLAIFQIGVALLGSVGLAASVIDLVVFRLRSDLRASSQTVGVAIGLASAGAVVGALLSPKLQRRVGSPGCVLGGTAVQAVGLVFAGSTVQVALVVVGLSLWAGGLTLRGVSANSLRQTLTPDALLGRVSAAAWTAVYAAASVGAILITSLAARTGTARALITTGAVLALLSLGAIRSPLGKTTAIPSVTEAGSA